MVEIKFTREQILEMLDMMDYEIEGMENAHSVVIEKFGKEKHQKLLILYKAIQKKLRAGLKK